VLAGAELDGAVAAGGADEALGGPAGAVLDEPGDGERREHDGQAGAGALARVVAADPQVSCIAPAAKAAQAAAGAFRADEDETEDEDV
jgi:hypothetical protein